MIRTFSTWFQQRFINTELGSVALIFITIILMFWWLNQLITPVLVSVVLAYLLLRIVRTLVRWNMSKTLAIYLVYLFFLGLLVFSLFILLPMLWDQLSLMINELPTKVQKAHEYIEGLAKTYPTYLSGVRVEDWFATVQKNFSQIGPQALSFSVTTFSKIVTLIVYLILVPIMVYFFMKDNQPIKDWLSQFLPRKRRLLKEIWYEIDQQMGQYISSKIIEFLILTILSLAGFLILGLNYAVLLAVLVGLSVFIPYVGVLIVAVPLFIVGYLEWGFGGYFLSLVIFFTSLMVLEGNILGPLLFSGTMRIHPLAVLIAILIFGGLWGFWGVFFGIPLVSVIKVLLNAWLRNRDKGPACLLPLPPT